MIKNSRTTSKINIVSSSRSSRRENYNISRLTAFGLLHAFTTSTVCFFLPHTKRILSGKWTSRKRNNFLWNFNFHQSSSSTYGGQEAATTAVTAQHTDRKRNTIGNDTHSVRVALFRHFHYDGFIKLLSKQSAKEEKKKKRPKTIWRNNRISAIVFTHNPPKATPEHTYAHGATRRLVRTKQFFVCYEQNDEGVKQHAMLKWARLSNIFMNVSSAVVLRTILPNCVSNFLEHCTIVESIWTDSGDSSVQKQNKITIDAACKQ